MSKDDIDADGYRLNVGIVLLNKANEVFWGRRSEFFDAWQFPQGGIVQGETASQAMIRELHEEVGLLSEDVEVIAQTKNWHRYEIPKLSHRKFQQPIVGQKQKWFLLRLLSSDDKISLDQQEQQEFVGWQWVDYWYPLQKAVTFKRQVYEQVLNEFSVHIPNR